MFRDALFLLTVLCLLVSWGCDGRSDEAPPPAPPAPEVVRTVAGPSVDDVGPAGADLATPGAVRRMVVTIDDLPLAMRDQYRDDAERLKTVRDLVAVLREADVPVVGFFNMEDFDAADPLVAEWLTLPKLVVGNHTLNHPNARRTPLPKFLSDLEAGHRAVEPLAGEGATIPFRFPYLNQGADADKRTAIFAKLDELGSPHLPPTIDTMDWYYARAWHDAVHDRDERMREMLHHNWLASIKESTLKGEWWADELFDHDPPQVVLLHANRLNAEHLTEAFSWWRERGYDFVRPDQVYDDPAFTELDKSVSPIGEVRWIRLHRSRQ